MTIKELKDTNLTHCYNQKRVREIVTDNLKRKGIELKLTQYQLQLICDKFDLKSNEKYFYKHVLTNIIGCFQSNYCIDWFTRHKIAPYQFAGLAKTAINGTKEMVQKMIDKLRKKGFVPLLSNTDGVWYYSNDGELYHDSNEGDDLCNWHHDHIDCEFLMLSTGKYQYIEKIKEICLPYMSVDKILLHVRAKNQRAVNCYIKCGFKESRR